MKVAAVADIGGTHTRVALVAPDGSVLAAHRWLPSAKHDAPLMIRELVAHLLRLAGEYQIDRRHIVGLGASVAGELDATNGYLYDAVNLGWRELRLADLLEAEAGMPALIEMDAHAAVIGESWLGLGQQARNLALIIVGTGIGAGLILGGEVYRGNDGLAGEFGHTCVQMNGPICGCGRFGCVEAMASGTAIAAAAHAAIHRGANSVLGATLSNGQLTASDVFGAARQGDACAAAIVRDAGRALATAITNLIHLLSPEWIVLSGGVAINNGDLLLPIVQAGVDLELGYWARRKPHPIVVSKLGDDGGLLGVARRVFERV
jgi:glucokinase